MAPDNPEEIAKVYCIRCQVDKGLYLESIFAITHFIKALEEKNQEDTNEILNHMASIARRVNEAKGTSRVAGYEGVKGNVPNSK